jgi:Family of unknown function (DUF5677)
MSAQQVSFGNPYLWQQVYSENKAPFDTIKSLETLMQELFTAAARAKSTKAQRVIEMLVLTGARSFNDLIILVGNGSGIGAMILSRGMFEYVVMAEYLRRNPREQADYTAFGIVTSWKRYQKHKKDSPAVAKTIRLEIVADLRKKYGRAAKRMKDKNGKLRRQWHRKPLRNMAEEIGLGEQYAEPYGIAASMHHGSFEGVAAHLSSKPEEITFGEPSAQAWIKTSLISGHTYILQLLETLNRAMRLGFKDRLVKANEEFVKSWGAEGKSEP